MEDIVIFLAGKVFDSYTVKNTNESDESNFLCNIAVQGGGAKLFKGGTKPSSSPSMRWAMNGLNSMFRRWLNVSSSILGEETFNIIFLSSWLTQYTLLALRVSSIVFRPPPTRYYPPFCSLPLPPFLPPSFSSFLSNPVLYDYFKHISNQNDMIP